MLYKLYSRINVFFSLSYSGISSKLRRAKVTYSYTADNDDELSLELGQIVEILDEEEEGWWKGRLNGVEGVFPSNFVEPIVEQLEEDNKC